MEPNFEALGRLFFDWASNQGIVVMDSLGDHQAKHQSSPEYLTIADLAERWGCSRGTVYNRLRAVGAKVLDFAGHGKKGRKAVHMSVILDIERRQTKRLM